MSEGRAITDESLAQAAAIVRGGGVIVIPTDTVYGIACDPRNAEAIQRIYQAKHRPQFKALQVLLASIDDIDSLGLDLPAPLNRLAAAFHAGRVLSDCARPSGLHVGDGAQDSDRNHDPRGAYPQFNGQPAYPPRHRPAGRIQCEPFRWRKRADRAGGRAGSGR